MACLPIAKLQSVCLRVKSAIGRRHFRGSASKRRSIKISDPYDFQHIMQGSPNNMNEDEMNILLRKTAATRMVAIEDQQQPQQQQSRQAPSSHGGSHRPTSASTNRSYFTTNGSQTNFGPIGGGGGSHSSNSAGGGGGATATGCARPKTPMKTRAGYRGLASSSAANGGRGLAYATTLHPTETRPSVTSSFAVGGLPGDDGEAGDDDGASPVEAAAASSSSWEEEEEQAAARNQLRGRSV